MESFRQLMQTIDGVPDAQFLSGVILVLILIIILQAKGSRALLLKERKK